MSTSLFKETVLSSVYWKSRSVVALVLLSFLLNLGGWLWVVFVIQPTSAQTLLHYTVQSGIDVIGPGTHAYTIPAIALGLILVNVVLAAALFRFEKFLSYLFLGVTAVLQAVFFVGVITVSLIAG